MQTMSSGTLSGQDIPLLGAVPPEVYRMTLAGDALTLTRRDTATRLELRRQ